MKKAIFTLIIVILIFVTTISVGADFKPAFDKNTEAEIIVAGSYNNFEALEAAFDAFWDFYPNVEMSFVKLDDYNNTIGIALAGEDAPDIYCMQPWMIGRENMSDLFAAAENLADPSLNIDFSNIRTGLLYVDPDGNVPMLPIFSTAFGFLVNENIFAKEGLKIPTTYEELITVTEKLKEAGYRSPIMGYNQQMNLFYFLTYTDFISRIMNDPEAIVKLNTLDSSAGEYLRPTLEFVKDVMDRGMIDLDACAEIENDYQAVILRFFEGDVPMMLASGDTASGTEKRQSLSEKYLADPFPYSLHAIPSPNEDLFFLNQLNLAFAVNKNTDELEMTNEFIRFLSQTESLNQMARIKRLITPTKDFSLDEVYSSYGYFDEAHTIYPYDLGVKDDVIKQMRFAAHAVGNGLLTIDEAVAAYGTLE